MYDSYFYIHLTTLSFDLEHLVHLHLITDFYVLIAILFIVWGFVGLFCSFFLLLFSCDFTTISSFMAGFLDLFFCVLSIIDF